MKLNVNLFPDIFLWKRGIQCLIGLRRREIVQLRKYLEKDVSRSSIVSIDYLNYFRGNTEIQTEYTTIFTILLFHVSKGNCKKSDLLRNFKLKN